MSHQRFDRMNKKRAPASTSLDPYNGPWDYAHAAHLVRRTMFGATAGDIAAIQAMTMTDAVDALLADDKSDPGFPEIWYHTDINGTTQGETWVTLDYDFTNDFNRTESLGAWWLSLMLGQNRSIREKMTLFWHNHFACGASAVSDARYSYKQNALF